jgi:hypothetical protein
MNGQWIGDYSGNVDGQDAPSPSTLVMNIDERETDFEGMAYAVPHNAALPTPVRVFHDAE